MARSPSRSGFERGRQPFGRNVPVRLPQRKIIIICEGTGTEFGYFNAIRQTLRLPVDIIDVRHCGATDPKSIVEYAKVEYAKAERASRERERRWDKLDEIWAVYDGDEHRERDLANWNAALNGAGKKVKLAISNPSFEAWYLLHFQDQNAPLHRDVARRLLKAYLPDYKKSNVLWPDPLQARLETAIQRAKNLAAVIEQGDRERCCNPSTGVHLLVESLLTLKGEGKTD